MERSYGGQNCNSDNGEKVKQAKNREIKAMSGRAKQSYI